MNFSTIPIVVANKNDSTATSNNKASLLLTSAYFELF